MSAREERLTHALTPTVRYVTVSEMQDFLSCQWRWFAKWVLNRVPRTYSTPLILGTAIHDTFETHFKTARPLEESHAEQVKVLTWRMEAAMDPAEVYAVAGALKEFKKYQPQIVGFADKYKIDETLEVEVAFEKSLLRVPYAWAEGPRGYDEWVFRGRPDRPVRIGDHVYHMQHKSVRANLSVVTYSHLLQRSMHEGTYGYYLAEKYCGPFTGLKYGGTIVNLIRKKAVDGKNPIESLGFQTMIAVDAVDRQRAWFRAKAIAGEMDKAEHRGRRDGIFALIDNPQEDGGMFGNSLDGYLPVLQGKARLDNINLFMNREETYDAAGTE